jgi:hypothetical protein
MRLSGMNYSRPGRPGAWSNAYYALWPAVSARWQPGSQARDPPGCQTLSNIAQPPEGRRPRATQDNSLMSTACFSLSQAAYWAPDLVLPLVHQRFEVRARWPRAAVAGAPRCLGKCSALGGASKAQRARACCARRRGLRGERHVLQLGNSPLILWFVRPLVLTIAMSRALGGGCGRRRWRRSRRRTSWWQRCTRWACARARCCWPASRPPRPRPARRRWLRRSWERSRLSRRAQAPGVARLGARACAGATAVLVMRGRRTRGRQGAERAAEPRMRARRH